MPIADLRNRFGFQFPPSENLFHVSVARLIGNWQSPIGNQKFILS
jgi:hypothetical protein